MKRAVARILAVYFIVGSLFPHTDFAQLQHIPIVGDHFRLHINDAILSGEDYNLLEFLWAHFIEADDHEHSDGTNHSDLPVRHFHQVIQLAFQPSSVVCNYLEDDKSQRIDFFTSKYTFQYLSILDRPPVVS